MRSWSLSDLALNRPITVSMMLLAVFVLGIIGTFRLPLAFMPTENRAWISVRAQVTRTSPNVLEREVIRPMEEALAGVRDLEKLQISSGSWGARASLNFRPGTDLDSRKLEVRERLDRVRADLPDLVQRLEISSDRGDEEQPAVSLMLASDRPLAASYYLLQRTVTRPLERIPGVARVELVGVEPHELEVAVNLDAADRQGVSLSDVGTTVRAANRDQGLGSLQQGGHRAHLRSPGVVANPEAFANLPINAPGRSAGDAAGVPVAGDSEADTTTLEATAEPSATSAGRSLRLRDLADVTLHPVAQRKGTRLNGKPSISVNVFVSSGASTVEVTRNIKAALPAIKAQPELGQVEIEVYEDEGEQIVKTLKDLRNSGIFGGAIGIVMLFLFLRRLRTTFVAAICIPLSILAATGILFFRGQELNCVVMLGLVLGVGIFIDNAVVIVESIQAQAQAGVSRKKAARIGARQVGLATIASTLSSAIVFLPLLSDNPADPMTVYLQPLGMTFVIALIASLFVSQTIIPMVMAQGDRPPRRQSSEGMEWLRRRYGRLIAASLRRPRATLIVGLLVSASTAWPLTQARFDLSEVEEETRSVRVRLEIVGKSGFERVIKHLAKVEEALLPQREALNISSIHCDYGDWYGSCRLYPSEAFQSEQAVSDFEARITATLPEQVGIKYHVGQGGGWRHRRYDPKVVRFVLRGDNMDSLFRLSRKVGDVLEQNLPPADPQAEEPAGLERVVGPYDEGRQEMSINLDIDRVHALRLRASDVAQAISSGFQGVSVGQASGPEGEVSIRMSTGGSEDDPSMSELADFRIAAPDGTEIPLRALANFTTTRSPYWIQRLDRQTEVRMSVHFAGGDPKANKAAVFELLDGVSLPPGYSAGEGTRWWKERENKTEMIVNLGLCLLLVYAVMASLFESFLQPVAIMLTCLLGCFGAPWAMYATDTTVDTVALIGLFILIGIAVNNGIILIDKSLQLRAQGMELVESLCESGRMRLRPILMTASTTILGLIPMLVYHPTLAGIYYHSIAIIVAAGLLSSTLVTLLFLPAAYLLIHEHAANARTLWRRFS